MGTVVMYSSVSVDGFIADDSDQPGPLFDWLTSGDVPLDDSGVLKVSQASYDYTRPYWDRIGATIVGRHVFDLTDGWDGVPPGGVDHVVVGHALLEALDALGHVAHQFGDLASPEHEKDDHQHDHPVPN